MRSSGIENTGDGQSCCLVFVVVVVKSFRGGVGTGVAHFSSQTVNVADHELEGMSTRSCQLDSNRLQIVLRLQLQTGSAQPW